MLKFRAELIGSGALIRFLGKRVADRFVELRWNIFDVLRERRGRFVDHLQDDSHGFAGERQLSGEHFVENDATTPNVGASIGGFAFESLGGQVLRRPDHVTGPGNTGKITQLDNAEIENLRVKVLSDHDVGGLDVAVDNTLCMSVGQARADLAKHVELLGNCKVPQFQELVQGLSGEEFHDQVGASILLANVIDGNQVGMVEHAGTRFEKKAAAQRFVIVVELLDRDIATDECVARAIDHTHAAAPKRGQYLVFSNRSRCVHCQL